MTFQPSSEIFSRLPLQILDVVAEARVRRPADLEAATLILDRLATLLDEAGLSSLQFPKPQPKPSAAGGGLPLWKARRVTSFIDEGLDRDLRISVLGGVAGLSPSYFAKAFSQTFGQTPRDYVLGRRLERAKSLLLETRQPLSQIALACGFADQPHMTRMFTRVLGQSPARWRRQRQPLLQ